MKSSRSDLSGRYSRMFVTIVLVCSGVACDRQTIPGASDSISKTVESRSLKIEDQPVNSGRQKNNGSKRPDDSGIPAIDDGVMDHQVIEFSDGLKGAIDEKSVVAGEKTLERLPGDEAAEKIANQHETTYVSINAASISSRGIAALVALPRLRALHIRQAVVDIEQLRMVVGCTMLEELSVTTSASDDEIGSLVLPNELRKLVLRGDSLGNNTLRVVGNLKGLEDLTIALKSVDESGISCLVELPNLRSLTLTGVVRSWLSVLSQLDALRELRITFAANDTGDVSWKLDCRLSRFSLIGNVSSNDLVAIGMIPSLEYLRITDSSFPGADLEKLAGLPNLKSLILSGTSISDEDLKYLTGLSNLHDLDLSHTRVTGKGVSALASHSTLKWLWLNDCELTEELVPSLEQLTELESITVVRSKMPPGLRDKLQKLFPKVPF